LRSPTPPTPHDIGRVARVVLDHLELVQIVAGEDNVFRVFDADQQHRDQARP
jgi:hypothetical protein